MFEKIKDLVTVEDDDDEETNNEMELVTEYEEPKNANMKIANDAKMILFEPRSFDEVDEIAKHLKEHKACVVNLHRLQKEYSQRTIDFLSGVVFALDGTIQKIGLNVILCTPKSIGVSGEITLDAGEE